MRPWGERALTLFAWGLAFHIVTMAFLFGLLRLPMEVVRALAAWKEVFVVVMCSAVAVRAVGGRGPGTRVVPGDLMLAALIGLTALHLLAALGGWGPVEEPSALAYGVRDLVFFFAMYFVGRATPAVLESDRLLGSLFVVGVVTSLVAVVEWAVATPEMLMVLGVASYFNEFLGTSLHTAGNLYGLPDNYWTMIGGRLVQRAGSVQLSSQGFAIPFLVLMPAATVWMYRRERWTAPIALLGYATLWAGLLLTITRMTILAAGLQVLLIVILRRRPAPLVALGAFGTTVFALVLATVPGIAGYVWDTMLWQTSSSGTHSRDYANGLAALVTHPLGSGLGTTDATAARLGLVPITGDNLVLKYAVELGIVAGALFVAFLAYLLWVGVRSSLAAADDRTRDIGALGAALALGVAVNGVTAVVFNSPMLAFSFFWATGAAVSVATVAADRG